MISAKLSLKWIVILECTYRSKVMPHQPSHLCATSIWSNSPTRNGFQSMLTFVLSASTQAPQCPFIKYFSKILGNFNNFQVKSKFSSCRFKSAGNRKFCDVSLEPVQNIKCSVEESEISDLHEKIVWTNQKLTFDLLNTTERKCIIISCILCSIQIIFNNLFQIFHILLMQTNCFIIYLIHIVEG